MANATCNTLKNHGDNCAQHDGHGAQHLSVVLAGGMRLAFLVDQPPQRWCALGRAVWPTRGSQRLGWARMRAVCDAYDVDAMRAVCAALWYGVEKSRPLLPIDPSSRSLLSLTRLCTQATSPDRQGRRMPSRREVLERTVPLGLLFSRFPAQKTPREGRVAHRAFRCH